MTFGTEIPCIICEKSLFYVNINGTKYADCVHNANTFIIIPGYGSDFDSQETRYHAIICDACLDTAIQKNRVLIQEPIE